MINLYQDKVWKLSAIRMTFSNKKGDSQMMSKNFKIFTGVLFLVCLSLAPILFLSNTAWAAEKFPSKQINLIVPYTAGGSTDLTVRLIADVMKEQFGVPAMVINKPGADGRVGMADLLKSQPDGHTLFASAMTTLVSAPIVEKVAFDPEKDVVPVAKYINYQFGVGVKADSSFKNLRDLIEYARKNPNTVKYSVNGLYTVSNIVMLYIADKENIKWDPVVYRGSAECMASVLGGHVTAIAGSSSVILPQTKSGNVRMISYFGGERHRDFPNSPTLKDEGFDFGWVPTWGGLFVQSAVPKDRVQILSQSIKMAMEKPDIREKVMRMGADPVYVNGPDFNNEIAKTREYLKKILKPKESR